MLARTAAGRCVPKRVSSSSDVGKVNRFSGGGMMRSRPRRSRVIIGCCFSSTLDSYLVIASLPHGWLQAVGDRLTCQKLIKMRHIFLELLSSFLTYQIFIILI